MDPVSCWHLSTSPHPHHRQCPPLPSNGGTITLHAISNPVWTSCRHMPLPWLVKEACGDVADSHKISSTMLKRARQLDSKMRCMVCAGSQVVRAWATYTVELGSNPARGPLLHVTPHLSLSFPVYPLSKKCVYASKKSLKKMGCMVAS